MFAIYVLLLQLLYQEGEAFFLGYGYDAPDVNGEENEGVCELADGEG